MAIFLAHLDKGRQGGCLDVVVGQFNGESRLDLRAPLFHYYGTGHFYGAIYPV